MNLNVDGRRFFLTQRTVIFIVKKRKYVRFYCSHTWLMCYNRWEYDILIKKGLNITNNNGNGDFYEYL